MEIKHFTTFTFSNFNAIRDMLIPLKEYEVDRHIIEDILSNGTINCVLTGINRLQSMLLCELNLSYVQQSQRYVEVDTDSISLPSQTPKRMTDKFNDLIQESIDLYKEMTELKDPNKKGRLTKDDFVHGIMYEDARYILPLCMKTNMTMSMTGDKLLDVIDLFIEYRDIFDDLYVELKEYIGDSNIWKILISDKIRNHIREMNICSSSYLRGQLSCLDSDHIVIKLHDNVLIRNIAMGALASQNQMSPDTIISEWENNLGAKDATEKALKLIERVIGYGHMGILEQAYCKFAAEVSLCAYHQVIRHRLQNIRRLGLFNIIIEPCKHTLIPPSINNNPYFRDRYAQLLTKYITTQKEIYDKYPSSKDNFVYNFLVNAQPIKFTITSNVRNLFWIFRERLCYTAQEEIRVLYHNIFKLIFNDYPDLMIHALPPCVQPNGKCKEGKMTCKQIEDVKKEYSTYFEYLEHRKK